MFCKLVEILPYRRLVRLLVLIWIVFLGCGGYASYAGQLDCQQIWTGFLFLCVATIGLLGNWPRFRIPDDSPPADPDIPAGDGGEKPPINCGQKGCGIRAP
jgi:hypothetical protein